MKKYIYLFALVALTLISCDKDDVNTLSRKSDTKTINSNIDELSSLIAKASGDNLGFRNLIKEEVGKKFDYDYDALLVTFIGKEIDGEKFEKILANQSDGKYSSDQIVDMIKSSGYLQISIPVLFDEFDPLTDKPLTAAIPVDINEKTIENFNAYNAEGSSTTLSARTDPNGAVFVVMVSERVDENGNLIVDENGFVIEDKTNRVHYSKVKSNMYNKQNIKSNQEKIINILSDNEFEKRMDICKKTESEITLGKDQLKKIVSATSNNLGYLLQVIPKDQLQLQLTWIAYNNANKYEIYRTGYININGSKVISSNKLIYTLTDTYTYTDNLPYANEEYTYYIKYFNNDTFLGETNLASAHSSHRKNNGLEYIKNVTISASTVVRLEGWWVSELELRCQYAYLNYDSVLVANNHVIPSIPTTGTGIWTRYVDWTYGDTRGGKIPAGTGNLFTWDRQGYGYGAYSLILEEWDASDQKQEKMDLWFDWVRFGLKLVGVKEVWGELINQVKKTITILDKPDYIGATNIKWWDPNDYIRNVGAGFTITINHNSNNN